MNKFHHESYSEQMKYWHYKIGYLYGKFSLEGAINYSFILNQFAFAEFLEYVLNCFKKYDAFVGIILNPHLSYLNSQMCIYNSEW